MTAIRGLGIEFVVTVAFAAAWLGCSDDTTPGAAPDSAVVDGLASSSDTGSEGGSLADSSSTDARADGVSVSDSSLDAEATTDADASPDADATTGVDALREADAATDVDATTLADATVDADASMSSDATQDADATADGSPPEAGLGDTGVNDADGGSPETAAGEAAAPVSCSGYCTGVMATCTGGFAQYDPASVAECTNACMFLPVGDAGATGGDSVACRVTHTGYAVTAANPHCWHAGPFGFGACGDECEAFCLIATGYCSPEGGFDGGAPPYASMSDCTTACASYARVNGGDAGLGVEGGYNSSAPTSGNTLDCREWHLGAALHGPSAQQIHCNHVGAVSPTCM